MRCVQITTLLFLLTSVKSAKILALFPFPGKSHFIMYSSLLEQLATRGHDVTVLSHFPRGKPLLNYTDLDVRDESQDLSDAIPFEWLDSLSFWDGITAPWMENDQVCDVLGHEHAKKLLSSNIKYDLIINEVFSTDCFLGFVHKLQIPFISMTSSVALPWGNARVGNPDNPSYIPNYYLPYTDSMTFMQRLANAVLLVGVKIAYKFAVDWPSNKMARKYFGDDLPPLAEIAENTSLILVNSHFSLNQPRPMVPGVVEVGGLHIQRFTQLPEDLDSFLNASTDGVILFSMGSMFNTATLSPNKMAALLNAFAALKQRVLWKVNLEDDVKLPNNVKTVAWLPQLDVLNHPSVRVFLTHGGLLGTQEAVYAGVPMVGIPLFADQYLNIEKYVAEGLAVKLDYKDITSQAILAAINRILEEKSYKQNAERMSLLFRDRPATAMETAIYWTEYVIEHGGANHLRSRAAQMPTYQYLLLDVIGAVLLGILIFITIFYKLFKLILLFFASNTMYKTKLKKS